MLALEWLAEQKIFEAVSRGELELALPCPRFENSYFEKALTKLGG